MKNTFGSWSDKIARIINPTFVRSHQEFGSSVWNPHLEYDSKTLESVQRRATLTKESHRLPYEKRLEGLTDLKTIREREDFIQIYYFIHSVYINVVEMPSYNFLYSLKNNISQRILDEWRN